MNTYLEEMDPSSGLISSIGDKGKELNAAYNANTPFPHTAIDNFLPERILSRIVYDFPPSGGHLDKRNQEFNKRSILPHLCPVWLNHLFHSFNSLQFIKLLENITGINGLIPDPYFEGGGLHELQTGGWLSMHADFSDHKPMNLERRINVLIYLNFDWVDAFGGQLELWDDRMTKCIKSYVPVANRCVIFNTTKTSMHGNPNPVNHPQGMFRRSIALYYYTATWDATKKRSTTNFKRRPGSSDKFDWKLKILTAAYDFLPPILLRQISKLKG